MQFQEFATAAELVEHYSAVRARTRKAPEPEPQAPIEMEVEIVGPVVHVQEPEPTAVVVHPSVARIVTEVCKYYKLRKAELLSFRKTVNVVRPRQVVMYLARRLTLKSLPTIGDAMDRDHTTILHGFQLITKLRATDEKLDADITVLEIILGGNHD